MLIPSNFISANNRINCAIELKILIFLVWIHRIGSGWCSQYFFFSSSGTNNNVEYESSLVNVFDIVYVWHCPLLLLMHCWGAYIHTMPNEIPLLPLSFSRMSVSYKSAKKINAHVKLKNANPNRQQQLPPSTPHSSDNATCMKPTHAHTHTHRTNS